MAYSGIPYDKNIMQDLFLHADLSHRPPCNLEKPEDVARQGELNDLLYSYFAGKVQAAGSQVIKPSNPITDVRLVVDAIKIYARSGCDGDTAGDLARKELKAADSALRSVLNIQRIP